MEAHAGATCMMPDAWRHMLGPHAWRHDAAGIGYSDSTLLTGGRAGSELRRAVTGCSMLLGTGRLVSYVGL